MTNFSSTAGKAPTLVLAQLAVAAIGLAIASPSTAQAADRDSVYAQYSCIELADEREAILSRHSSASRRVIRALREIRYFEERRRCARGYVKKHYDYAPVRYRGYRKSPYDKYVRMCPRTGRPLW